MPCAVCDEWHNRYAECLHPECHYAKCRGYQMAVAPVSRNERLRSKFSQKETLSSTRCHKTLAFLSFTILRNKLECLPLETTYTLVFNVLVKLLQGTSSHNDTLRIYLQIFVKAVKACM